MFDFKITEPDDGELELVLDPARHRVLEDTDWVRMVQRELKAPDLFLYYHILEKTFVLSSWVKKGRSCRELRVFQNAPWANFDSKATLESIRRRLRPPEEHERDMKDKIRRDIRDKERVIEERHSAKTDAVRLLKSKGLYEGAALMEAGATPIAGEGEGGEYMKELKERLVEASKNRVSA